MFISGTLSNKTNSFYKENIVSFDENSYETNINSISYNNEITFVPWEKDKERELIKRQEFYIKKITEEIIKISSIYKHKLNNGISIYNSVNDTLELIKNTKRNITFILLENLKNIISNTNFRDIPNKLKQYQNLIDYLEVENNFRSYDIYTIIKLFLKNNNYLKDDIYEEKKNTLNIDEREINDSNIYKIYRFGEFVAPDRLALIGKNLEQEELTRYIAPIFFTIKDEIDARKFLYLSQTRDLDFSLIEKNAKLCRVPKNIIDTVRR